MKLGNGIHLGMSREDYDREQRVNWSKLKFLDKSAAHFRHAQLAEHVDTDAMKFGRCAHLATLEPERFVRECAIWDGGTRRGKDWIYFKKKNAGLELLTEDEYRRCKALQSAVRNDAVAAPYLRNGKSEVTAFWTYEAPQIAGLEAFAVDCKSRIDFVTADALVDLKTARSARPDEFTRSSWNLQYHAQAAFYVDAYAHATGRRLPYVIVAVESVEPYVVQVYTVSAELLDAGRDVYRPLLSTLNLCRQNNSWPGYADGPLDLGLPSWMAAPDDETGLGLDFGESAQ